MRRHQSRGCLVPGPAALAGLLLLAGVSPASAQPNLVYVGAEVSGGNGDDWIEPGETIDLQVRLFNRGSATAVGVAGSLTYTGTAPGVAVTVPTATWPNLPFHSAALLTNPPHFELQVPSHVPCGEFLPFRLEVHFSGGLVSFGLNLKVGQRIDHDLLHDPARRFDEQEATFWGHRPDDHVALATAMGDFNGDGFSDFVMADNDNANGGKVYLIYGRAQQLQDGDLSLPYPQSTHFTDANPASLAAGDVNGDGYDDIIVADYAANPFSRNSAGQVTVVYGRASLWPITNLGSSTPIPGVARFAGAAALDFFGKGVAAGDINGDGFDDVVAGAYNAASIGDSRPQAGEVYLIYGKAAPWNDTDLLSPPPGVAIFWGADPGDWHGNAVATGDVNGDGLDDMLLGAVSADSIGNQRPQAGEVTLAYGRQAAWTDTDLASPPAGIVRFWGIQSGLSARTTGDFDGDRIDDLVFWAWWSVPGQIGAWRLFLVYGQAAPFADTDLLAAPPGVIQILGDQYDVLGWSELNITSGDLNGDGYDDLIAGASQENQAGPGPGKAYVIHGSPRRWTDIDLRSRPATIPVFTGVDLLDYAGYAAAAGDVNNDGYDDLLMGAPLADSLGNLRPDAGEAYLLYGKPTDTYLVAPATSSPYIPTTQFQGAQKLALSCDDCSVQVPIGFRFPFYAEEFNTLFVSSNGYLSFSPPTPGSLLTETCMPSRTGANHLIAPYWDDLNPGASATGGAFALLQGTAPYRRLTIEWKDVPHATSVGLVTFEVTLYETTGQIHFRYKDVLFGVPALDNGASAVVGVENRTGAHGVAFSCNVSTILDSTRVIRLVPTTPIFEEHGELTGSLWRPTGHWHNSTNTCEPDQHAGSRGWYYGNAASCTYSNGFSGALRAPTVEDFPADARLAYWSRLGTQPGVDLPEVQLSTTGTGGPYTTFQSPGDSSMIWRYAGYSNLFFNAGDTVDLQYNFSSNASVSSLGWMVDDVQLVGCDATGAAQVVLSTAYAPPQVCEGASKATVDSLGSYCGGAFDPVRYQWFENGASIPGAESETHTIPDTLRPGTYEYSVEITCENGTMALSEPAPVMIVFPPNPVAPTLEVAVLQARPAPVLLFRWEESAGADEYVVLQDAAPNGSFMTELGTSSAGDPTLRVPIPPGDILYFLVAGRNLGCGLGPIR